MSHRRQFVLWIVLATLAVVLFLLIMQSLYQPTQRRFALNVTPRPAEGRNVFQAKGCAKCHGSDGAGTPDAPALRERTSLTSLPLLVTAVWNHVPRMSEAMQQSHMPYPTMSSEDMAQLFAYLYVTGVTDQSGDAERGRAVFSSKGCVQCHSGSGQSPAGNVLGSADTPLLLTQSLWNHATGMTSRLQQRGMTWPALKAGELRDLLAYIQLTGGRQAAPAVRVGDPARGWAIFQAKACLDCHTLGNRKLAASDGPSGQTDLPRGGDFSHLPPTLSQFGEAMLNHFPDMHHAMNSAGKTTPSFTDNELGDLAVFLYSLRYVEPAGSPHVGATIFRLRGCSSCHGEDAAGAAGAPALRGRGRNYTAVRLAMGLWAHGDRMYEERRKSGQPWPHLEESDIGDLLSFLNTPLGK